VVTTLTAVDGDLGERVQYAIVAGNPGQPFAIDPTSGVVQVVGSSRGISMRVLPVWALSTTSLEPSS